MNARAGPELLASGAERDFTCIRRSSPNAAPWMIPGLFTALRLILRFWRQTFVVWAHHSDSNRWLQVALAATRRKFVVMEQLVPAARSDFARSRLSIPLKRLVASHARSIILNGHSQKEHYCRLFGVSDENIRVISNSRPVSKINTRVGKLRETRTALRRELGLADSPTLVCIARLAAQKDQATLITAVAKLSKKLPDVQLVLVGDGPDLAALRDMAKQASLKEVFFPGHAGDPFSWLAAADVFVLPSLSEGLPGALIEAMAAALPCVASDIPGNRELIRHEATGLLVPVKNPEALATAIERLLLDNDLSRRLAATGFDLVAKEYDESVERAGWEKMFSTLV